MDVGTAPPGQDQGGGGVEGLNINNRWLPYAESIAAAPDVTLTEVVEGLQTVLEREEELDAKEADADEGDEDAGGGWNERGVGPHLKKLDSLLALKLKFNQGELGGFIRVAYRLMQSPRLSLRSQVRMDGGRGQWVSSDLAWRGPFIDMRHVGIGGDEPTAWGIARPRSHTHATPQIRSRSHTHTSSKSPQHQHNNR